MCEIVKKVESHFLSELFMSFDQEGIKYCVLRNYSQLPNSMGGSDLDLAVLPEQSKQAGKCVLAVAEKYGAELLMDYTASGRMIRLLGCYEGQWWGAAVDLFWAMDYKGIEYLPVSYLIGNSKIHRGIRVANDVDAIVTALVKELLSNGVSRKEYFGEVVAAHQSDCSHVRELLDRMFSPKAAASLVQTFGDKNPEKRELSRCVSLLRRNVLGMSWISQFPLRVCNLYRRLKRVILHPGRAIAVMGTDGSGKTTLIDAMMPVLTEATHNEVEYKHLRPNMIPALGSVGRGKSSQPNAPVNRPHDKEASGSMMSLFRVIYYSLDYYIGYWVTIYPSLVKRAHICIFDRYFYDFLIDQKRMRIRLPQWVITLVFKFAPKPSLILCLGGNPEKIYQRKPETSLHEVTRQVNNLKEFCVQHEKAVWIDTTKSVSISVNQALTAIQKTKPWYVR